LNNSFNTIVSVGITFIVTLVLNSALNYYASDRGTIGISRSVPIEGKSLTVVTIENYSREFLDGVALEIPTSIPLENLFSDTPVMFVDAPLPHQAKSRSVRINQISPRLVTRVFIPAPIGASSPLIRIANPEASGVSLRRDDELESPLRKAVLSALVVAVLYAVFTLVNAFISRRDTKALRGEVEGLSSQAKRLSSRVNDVETRAAKHRLLLQARLFDYSKELEHWRNAFKTLVLSSGGKSNSAEAAIREVTKMLGTHGTREPAEGFESIRVAAGWLSDIERSGSDPGPQKKGHPDAQGGG
jgi:hypothetical protein